MAAKDAETGPMLNLISRTPFDMLHVNQIPSLMFTTWAPSTFLIRTESVMSFPREIRLRVSPGTKSASFIKMTLPESWMTAAVPICSADRSSEPQPVLIGMWHGDELRKNLMLLNM